MRKENFHFWIYKSQYFLYEEMLFQNFLSWFLVHASLFLFITLVTSNAFKKKIIIFLLTLLYISFFISPFLEKAKSLQKWIKRKQYCSCQACTVTRSLHHDALTASNSCALALLFPIRASGCCTNQIPSKISEGLFFSSAAQVPGQRANTVLFYWHRSSLMPAN